MSPNASDRPFPGGKPGARRGFTLLETLVAVVASAILLWGLTRFFQDTSRSYDLQAQILERDQNAHFTVKCLTEALQQSGASLPDSGFSVITVAANPASSIILGSNPRGGVYFMAFAGPANLARVPVGDTALFTAATHALVDYANPARATVKRALGGKKKGAAGAADTLLLAANLPFQLGVGDVVYAYREETYALTGSDLTLGGLVLAENIDTLEFRFYDAAKAATTSWSNMRSALIKVTARTPHPDPRLPGDGYRRMSLSMNVFLRSRV